MKAPTWGTVVGVLMILFGGCSALNDVQMIFLPDKLQEGMSKLEKKKEERNTEKTDSVTVEVDSAAVREAEAKQQEGMEMAEKILTIPEFTKTWMIRFAYIGIVVSLIYAVAGIFLIKPQSYSIKLAYGALILSIAASGIQTVVLTSSGSAAGVIGLTTGLSQILSIIIDIVLLSVVFASDKEAYPV